MLFHRYRSMLWFNFSGTFRTFSASKSKIIGEIVRQDHVCDFMEHMLNRRRTRAIRARWNIHFSARFCRSVGLNESESFGFLWVLQSGMKSSRILLSFAPRSLSLCQTIFFCCRFCKHSLVLLYSSLFRLFPSFSFLHVLYGLTRIYAGFRCIQYYCVKKFIYCSNAVEQTCFDATVIFCHSGEI